MAKERSQPVAVPAAGSIVHFELYTDQPERTQRFYEDVFGWRFTKPPGTDYTSVQLPAAPNGGLMQRTDRAREVPGFLSYIRVESVEAVSRKITQAGGRILMPKYEVPDVGWFALFEAPGGVVQAVWEQNAAFRHG